jgi:hypothetical protein
MQSLNALASSLSLSQTSSDIWFGNRNQAVLPHRQRRLLTEKQIFSPAYYYIVGTSGNALKCHIISAVVWLDYSQTSVFISIYQTQVKLEPPSGVCQ